MQPGVGLLTRAILIEDTCKIAATTHGQSAVTSLAWTVTLLRRVKHNLVRRIELLS